MIPDKHYDRFALGGGLIVIVFAVLVAATLLGMGVKWMVDHADVVSKLIGTIVGGLVATYVLGYGVELSTNEYH